MLVTVSFHSDKFLCFSLTGNEQVRDNEETDNCDIRHSSDRR